MFRKLPQEMLTEANEQLQQQIVLLRQELYMRAAPRIAEMQTALGAVTQAADKGDISARQLLHSFFETWRKAEAAASGIVIPTQRPTKFEEPTRKEGWSADNEQESSS